MEDAGEKLVAQSEASSQGVDEEREEDDIELFGLTEDDGSVHGGPTILSILDDCNEIITCLMRISAALRNPARNDEVRYADVASTKLFEPHDMNHVRNKFPEASEYLVVRLGKAISRNRQFFKYREEHHARLTQETIFGDGSTKASSIPRPKPLDTVGADDDGESMYTATSFALSSNSNTDLGVPRRPTSARDAEPWECPFCYHFIIAADEISWRRHVFEDLPPYVCLIEDCQVAKRQYSRRHEWQHHMKTHTRFWMCPQGCEGTFDSAMAFKEHLSSRHGVGHDSAAYIALKDSCKKEDSEAAAYFQQCALCLKALHTSKSWFKHVGRHLVELALFALPTLPEPNEDGDGDSDQIMESPDDESPDSLVGIRPRTGFRCTHPGCGKCFDRAIDFQKHTQRSHVREDQRAWECPHHACKKRFIWPKDLARHRRQVHGEVTVAPPVIVHNGKAHDNGSSGTDKQRAVEKSSDNSVNNEAEVEAYSGEEETSSNR